MAVCRASTYFLFLLLAGSPMNLPATSDLEEPSRLAAQLPKASSVVEPHVYVSLAPVPRGRRFEIAVVANIRSGFHLNAHEVLQDYLIPTSLEAELPPGFRVLVT